MNNDVDELTTCTRIYVKVNRHTVAARMHALEEGVHQCRLGIVLGRPQQGNDLGGVRVAVGYG